MSFYKDLSEESYAFNGELTKGLWGSSAIWSLVRIT